MIDKSISEISTPKSVKLIASNLTVKRNLKQFKKLAYSTSTNVTMTDPDDHEIVDYVLDLELAIVRITYSAKSNSTKRHKIADIRATFEAKFKANSDWVESLELVQRYTQSVFPFVQEYVSDVTHRMGFPSLLLPQEALTDLSPTSPEPEREIVENH